MIIPARFCRLCNILHCQLPATPVDGPSADRHDEYFMAMFPLTHIECMCTVRSIGQCQLVLIFRAGDNE